jgi:hypothetical protein
MVQKSLDRVTSLQKEVSGLETQETEVLKLKKSFAAISVQEKTLSSFFVEMNNPVPFFETIESYGATVGAVVSFENVLNKKDPNELDASLKVKGSFSSVYRFLELLEVAPYEFSIKNIILRQGDVDTAVSSGKKTPQVIPWEARVELSVVSVTEAQ